MLFRPAARFQGLPREGFETFAIPSRDARRRSIVETIHPALEDLAADLLEPLSERLGRPLHRSLPRLDWPRSYEPFCTWLVLSIEAHGYQSGPQLNLGVHADHVGIRLGWDTDSDDFGRFEFLCLYGDVGPLLTELAQKEGLAFSVFAAADWPVGSTRIFESADDLQGAFAEANRRGVWWEIGRHFDLPGNLDRVCSPAFGEDVERIFTGLIPAYRRLIGEPSATD